ncbi:hypothetical protein C8F04DRAFT_1255677 [Mycena alexandri]|uniref:DDE-1 domain-containing protein n=1 Tax=Mycena alexandri TaxID=1745969 RepID=A0AAD6T5D8_9AGAR|nr:hypothetical protein C8F04DRAFT_1255677 [Mycena alexandri]
MTPPEGVVRYGDSFSEPMPEEMTAACQWWLKQHTTAKVGLEDLPIGRQADGFSCGMLVDNAGQHFVDPSIPLAVPKNFADARLEVFLNICGQSLEQLERERQLVIAGDEDSADESDRPDPVTATSANLHDKSDDSDSERAIPLLRSTTRNAKFTFTVLSPISSPPQVISPARPMAKKRAKGDPDAPTPNPSPAKRRIYKRGADDRSPSAQPSFASPRATGDVFGPRMGYRSDSDGESGEEGVGDADEYSWGPEDNAPLPPDSQVTPGREYVLNSPPHAPPLSTSHDIFDNIPDLQDPSDSEDNGADSGDNSDNASVASGMPDLQDPSNSSDDAEDSDNNSVDETVGAPPGRHRTATPPAHSKTAVLVGKPKTKISGYFSVETAVQRAARLEEQARVYAEGAEEARMREELATWGKLARKCLDLLDRDDTTPPVLLPELSRPHHQFKEDDRKNNKPCGRKQKAKNKKRNAKYTNWFHPLLWSQIQAAGGRASKTNNLRDFYRLTEQVLGRWIDPDARKRGTSKWKDSVLQNVERGKGNAPGGHTTRCGVLHPYPETRKKINDHLTSLRGARVILTLLLIRGIMDGSKFHCSESFTRHYLRNTLGWSERRTTKAAQKLPDNYEKILEEAFFRQAHVIRDYAVPAGLRVNTDQTQIVYQQGTGSTWTQRSAKQVASVGKHEKRAFTGKKMVSCPSLTAGRYDEAVDLGYAMLPSGTSMYWSNHETMHVLVDDIIAPYFESTKVELGLPKSQVSIWLIDCWSVHKSKDFLAWMKKHHKNIIVLFVPGGCTGVWQPLDVGIQRLLKLSVKCSAHCDIVEEALAQIAAGKVAHERAIAVV